MKFGTRRQESKGTRLTCLRAEFDSPRAQRHGHVHTRDARVLALKSSAKKERRTID